MFHGVRAHSADSADAIIWTMPTVVLDTSVLVAALLRGGGSARAVLRACLRGQYQPVIGPATYSAVVIVVIVTTLVTPFALTWSLKRT